MRHRARFTFGSSLVALSLALLGGCASQPPLDTADTVDEMREGDINGRLDAWYNQPSNYAQVERDVRGFYPAFRTKGCVAFLSSALRRVGVKIPMGDPSLGTSAFSAYLIDTLGWKKVSAEALQPGDVMFASSTGKSGEAAHTYMFHSWETESEVAWVIDNQGFRHKRNIPAHGGGLGYTPFAYALRAPTQVRTRPQQDVVECETDGECDDGDNTARACFDGVCLQVCVYDAECSPDEKCVARSNDTETSTCLDASSR